MDHHGKKMDDSPVATYGNEPWPAASDFLTRLMMKPE